MDHRHPFNLPAELIYMILEYLSLPDYFSIARVSLRARCFTLPTIQSLTLQEKLDELGRAVDDDNHGNILELIPMLRHEISARKEKFPILHTLFLSSCTKAMRIWLAGLAPSGKVATHRWRKEKPWKDVFRSAMKCKTAEAAALVFGYGAPVSAILDALHPDDDPWPKTLRSLPKRKAYCLHHAVIRGYQAAVDFLLARDGDAYVNVPDTEGMSPLESAVRLQWTGIVESLLAYNARTDFTIDWDGETILHNAVKNEREYIVLVLIARGTDLDVTDKAAHPCGHQPASGDGRPLIFFAINGGPGMIALLVKHGADVNMVHPAAPNQVYTAHMSQQTPLLCAIQNGRVESVRALLEAGADAFRSDKYGYDAWEYAKSSEYRIPLLRLLRGRS
ncbi:hypothetical protein ASPSYDRAFT_1175191 [Aspergillus sydowii CBS 593.65]|uniref:F-box domain-containing protein n=1 Tax=Aspergillus sydowii CBS 593.65 TaxID=1036612 RepID=A0A1L9TK48_9EURO|nr:uncharacterized protein ASPSYDRAFT_1175191 [Aspergillus sydowii CBS 593.65]OJJ59806.1 hypothetical protein ASPSYDRAFT_1175191 [Aspergillus sydowii CBS 593.65]